METSPLPGADLGFKVRGGATQFEAGSLGAVLRLYGEALVGSQGQSPRKLLDFRDFIRLETCLPRSHFITVCTFLLSQMG
jgi:hypothetical protein